MLKVKIPRSVEPFSRLPTAAAGTRGADAILGLRPSVVVTPGEIPSEDVLIAAARAGMFLYAEAGTKLDLALAEHAIPLFEGIWLAGPASNFQSVGVLEGARRLISLHAPSLSESVDVSDLPRLRTAYVSLGLESALLNPGLETLRFEHPSITSDLSMPPRLRQLYLATKKLNSFPSLSTGRLETLAIYVPRGVLDLRFLKGADKLQELTVHCTGLENANVLSGLPALRRLSLIDVKSVDTDLLDLRLDFFMANRNYMFDESFRVAAERRYGVCVIAEKR